MDCLIFSALSLPSTLRVIRYFEVLSLKGDIEALHVPGGGTGNVAADEAINSWCPAALCYTRYNFKYMYIYIYIERERDIHIYIYVERESDKYK